MANEIKKVKVYTSPDSGAKVTSTTSNVEVKSLDEMTPGEMKEVREKRGS